MTIIFIHSEADLIAKLKQSAAYERFRSEHFDKKTRREEKAWRLLKDNEGHFTRDILDQIFDVVDMEGEKRPWFGSLLATPNRNLIFQNPAELVSSWIDYVCFSGESGELIIDKCLGEKKIKGASKGLFTLLLYLSNPSKYAIWVNSTYNGLKILGRLGEKKSCWGDNYAIFNTSAIQFARDFSFHCRELDWILWFIGSNIKVNNSKFEIDEDAFGIPSTRTSPRIPRRFYGEPIDFRGLRHAPINEQGVVYVFGMESRELGFYIEAIQQGFPDCEGKCLYDPKKNLWVNARIEFEFKASNFQEHGHDPNQCDFIVCWINDWPDCPITVIELRKEILRLKH